MLFLSYSSNSCKIPALKGHFATTTSLVPLQKGKSEGQGFIPIKTVHTVDIVILAFKKYLVNKLVNFF
jgi:hypothetical protein